MRILIADDNELVRRGVIAILAGLPHLSVCGEAGNSQDAIEKARELRPDLILLDINMPGISGLEVPSQLRREKIEAKILIMSQNDPRLFLQRAIAAGAQGCIDKNRLGSDLLLAIQGIEEENARSAMP